MIGLGENEALARRMPERTPIENRIIGDEADLTNARLMLAVAVQNVIRTGLWLLGVSAPLKM